MKRKNWKKRIGVVYATIIALVLSMAPIGTVFAATPFPTDAQLADLQTANLTISKALTTNKKDVFPNVDSFTYTIDKVSFAPADTGVAKSDDTTKAAMPAATGTTIYGFTKVAADSSGLSKTLLKQLNLDFSGTNGNGVPAGVYTYKVKETAVTGSSITYDATEYYVNIYVVNQVDQDNDNEPTGKTYISQITSYKKTNTGELSGMTDDYGGNPPDKTTAGADESGKSGISDNNYDVTTTTTPVYDSAGTSTSATIANSGRNTLKLDFKNSMETANLKVTKAVKGNYASTDKYFKYDITLTGLPSDGPTEYAVKYTDSTGAVMSDPGNISYQGPGAATGTTVDRAEEITVAGGAATATASIYIKHGESFEIVGLPASVTYTVKEAAETGYVPKFENTEKHEKGNGDDDKGDAAKGNALEAVGTLKLTADKGTMKAGDSEDVTVAFTNTRSLITPTGVLLNILPYLIAVIISGAVLMITIKKRKNKKVYTGEGL